MVSLSLRDVPGLPRPPILWICSLSAPWSFRGFFAKMSRACCIIGGPVFFTWPLGRHALTPADSSHPASSIEEAQRPTENQDARTSQLSEADAASVEGAAETTRQQILIGSQRDPAACLARTRRDWTPIGEDKERKEETEVTSDQWPVASQEGSGGRDQDSDPPEIDISKSEIQNLISDIPNPQSPIPDPPSPRPLRFLLHAVWPVPAMTNWRTN